MLRLLGLAGQQGKNAGCAVRKLAGRTGELVVKKPDCAMMSPNFSRETPWFDLPLLFLPSFLSSPFRMHNKQIGKRLERRRRWRFGRMARREERQLPRRKRT